MSAEKCEICKVSQGFSCRKPTTPLVPGRLELRENQPMRVVFERIEECSLRKESLDGHGNFLTFVDTKDGGTGFVTVDPRNKVCFFRETGREIFGPFDSTEEAKGFIRDHSDSHGFALQNLKEDNSK